jgi:hypothetical protein
MTTFIYEYPDGKDPIFWVHEKWVVTYPGGDRRYYMQGDYWHPFPEGGAATLRVHQGFVYDFPEAAELPRFYLREVDQ